MPNEEGLLFSQIGHDPGAPAKIIWRGASRESLPPGSRLRVLGPAGTIAAEVDMGFWGEAWHSAWWIAQTPGLPAGEYALELHAPDRPPLRRDGWRIAPRALWSASWRWCSFELLRRRAQYAPEKPGWFDAGMLWQEVNSHAAAVLGLCDLLEYRADEMAPEERGQIETQLRGGCTYLGRCQDHAASLGRPKGSIYHDLTKNCPHDIPGDVAKAAAAWARAALFLAPDAASEFRTRAADALAWFETAQPLASPGFSPVAHGTGPDYVPAAGWRTDDLLMRLEAAVALARGGQTEYLALADALLATLKARQIPAENPRHGWHGHFLHFDDPHGPTLKAWTHNNVGRAFGHDDGATHGFHFAPLTRLAQGWPQRPSAGVCRGMAERFARDFLLPVSRLNPFALCPLGVYGEEGPLWFAGLWHGMNAAYGQIAALALDWRDWLGEPALGDLAEGNLQWIAGLNAGLTDESLAAAAHFHTDVPAGEALPVSMICGVGRRWAGSWLQTRGAICNGFSGGKQFQFSVPVDRAHDRPAMFTDEDWITHAGGWLSGIARL